MIAEFMTRVELLNGDDHEYLKLDEYMDANGFKKTILGKVEEYYLPQGEYHMVKNLTDDDVMSLAKSAANKTGKQFSIIVSEVSNIQSFGLRPRVPKFSISGW